jgi:hypothetical protein
VRTALAGPAPTPYDLNNPQFPLRRFVVCDACSTPLTGSASKGRSKRYAYYHCRACKGVSVRKEQLEARFVELLNVTQPRPEFMRLFREIVLDVWKGRRREAAAIEATLSARLGELQRREALLEAAFLYEGKIDAQAYERQRDDLRNAMAMATIELEDARG